MLGLQRRALQSSSCTCSTSGRSIVLPAVMQPRRVSSRLRATPAKDPSSTTEPPTTGAGLKAVWYGAEIFGKLVNMGKGGSGTASSAASTASKMTRDQIVEAIREDYSTNYFVSGVGNMAAYAEDCEFSDPFVAFKGTQRFKQNVGNLGGMMQDVKLDVYDWKEEGADKIVTKWRFSCVLDLPWRPLLAAAGGTTHVIDLDSGKVVRHIEAWDVEPSKVVAQLIKPASKVPQNKAETFALALSDGDVKGMWLASSWAVLTFSAPVIGVSLLCKAATGEGLPGVFLGSVEGLSYLGFVSALVTEAYKVLTMRT